MDCRSYPWAEFGIWAERTSAQINDIINWTPEAERFPIGVCSAYFLIPNLDVPFRFKTWKGSLAQL